MTLPSVIEMQDELPKQYDPTQIEKRSRNRWLESRAFATAPDDRERRYVIMMPLPNVTGALHLGHAMDNVMQDLLIRWHRMMGENALWMPGTDHAGIATQAVVEKRLLEFEGKNRHDIGREALVARIWEWKDQYQTRIIEQQQAMGCSCDWDRQRFTMDAVCARAVYWTFFRLFRDGLIFRGNRLVNWDCHLQTAVSDDEIIHETVRGKFWHLRYPVIDPLPGEPTSVVVATTRPETMLGDTAVACHPDPEGALTKRYEETRARLDQAAKRDAPALAAQLESIEERQKNHLEALVKLVAMARDGRRVMLPLLERPMPLICDEWAKPELASGCVKITPAHDPNDYEVWKRHADDIDVINILEPDGTLNANAGPYAGQDRFRARAAVVRDLDARGLLAAVEDRDIEIGHSDRSKTPIEPYLSEQWFVKMRDTEGGITCGRDTDRAFQAPGLAQAAIDAVEGDWLSATGRRVVFHPDALRYKNTYCNWLAEKRDWCISRQLWWGHQIPIWSWDGTGDALRQQLRTLEPMLLSEEVAARVSRPDGSSMPLGPNAALKAREGSTPEGTLLVCVRDPNKQIEAARALEEAGFIRDPDVLDTWFSSGVWPHSTLGWPDPETAEVNPGQPSLGSEKGAESCLRYYYPGSCLVTGRDIITLWVARMVVMGLYNLGDVPFTDVFIHATILDGKGERMSKSKGNGIDPVDLIDRYGGDAVRYVLCEMQTGSQDIRLPVQAISPFTGETVDLAKAKHGRSIFTYLCPKSKKEFDVLGTMPDIPSARLVSERFEVGRNFLNKLWNAARFALMNLSEASFTPRSLESLDLEDCWILSRLSRMITEVRRQLELYNPSAATAAAREFFWAELCDWYLEIIKPRLKDEDRRPAAQQVLALTIDQMLRLLHPFVPFVTEALWERLNALTPKRGIEHQLGVTSLLVHAPWPDPQPTWENTDLETRFAFTQRTIRAIRDVRSKYGVAPRDTIDARIKAAGDNADFLRENATILRNMANVRTVTISPEVDRTADAATAVVGDVEIYVPGVVDVGKERTRLTKQHDKLSQGIEAIRKKLANESFTSRAKPEVVEREQTRLHELESQLDAVGSHLAALADE